MTTQAKSNIQAAVIGVVGSALVYVVIALLALGSTQARVEANEQRIAKNESSLEQLVKDSSRASAQIEQLLAESKEARDDLKNVMKLLTELVKGERHATAGSNGATSSASR